MLIWTRKNKTQHTKAAAKKKKKAQKGWKERLFERKDTKHNAYSNQTVQKYAVLSGWNKHSFKLFVRFDLVS